MPRCHIDIIIFTKSVHLRHICNRSVNINVLTPLALELTQETEFLTNNKGVKHDFNKMGTQARIHL